MKENQSFLSPPLKPRNKRGFLIEFLRLPAPDANGTKQTQGKEIGCDEHN